MILMDGHKDHFTKQGMKTFFEKKILNGFFKFENILGLGEYGEVCF